MRRKLQGRPTGERPTSRHYKRPQPADLSLVGRVARRWWWVALGLFFGVVAAALTLLITPQQYRANASVLLTDEAAAVAGLGIESGDPLRNAQTQQAVLLSPAVARAAGQDTVPEYISVSSAGGDVLVISALGDTPDIAADRANAWVAGYFTVSADQLQQQLAPVQENANSRLIEIQQELVLVAAQEVALTQAAALAGESPDASELASLEVQRDGLVTEQSSLQSQVSDIGRLLLLGSPYARTLSTADTTDVVVIPDRKVRLALFGIAGGSLAFALALTPVRRTTTDTGTTDATESSGGARPATPPAAPLPDGSITTS